MKLRQALSLDKTHQNILFKERVKQNLMMLYFFDLKLFMYNYQSKFYSLYRFRNLNQGCCHFFLCFQGPHMFVFFKLLLAKITLFRKDENRNQSFSIAKKK